MLRFAATFIAETVQVFITPTKLLNILIYFFHMAKVLMILRFSMFFTIEILNSVNKYAIL